MARVLVYQWQPHDPVSDRYGPVAARRGTLEAIAKAGGRAIEDSPIEVGVDELDADQFYSPTNEGRDDKA